MKEHNYTPLQARLFDVRRATQVQSNQESDDSETVEMTGSRAKLIQPLLLND